MISSYSDLPPDLVLFRLDWILTPEGWPDAKQDWRGDLLVWQRSLCWIWVEFFQDNRLTKGRLAESSEDITPEFELRLSDLTETGFAMYRVVEEKWYAQLGRRDEAGQRAFVERKDTSLLEKHLGKYLDLPSIEISP